ncbi:probable leucine--tRNA ligase, mitochondrial isoform X2 [Ptychodera flava]|uniref:probable leucine--tRNA ligase, mitochondrial isoform X2 n=1 Tax=Ptychodera flava TaxID=63121 RepID=UPI003969EDB0
MSGPTGKSVLALSSCNIEHMRKQLQSLSMCFDWDREIFTCREDYYKWTQYLFLKLFQSGFVYQKLSWVNWDPVDQTVLANEQVDDEGCSWRSGAKVEKQLLKQWFVKMTHYSKSLLDGLDELPCWSDGIKSMQANWISDCSGCAFQFKLKIRNELIDEVLSIYTDRPECIFGAACLVLSPDHILLRNKDFQDKLLDSDLQTQLANMTKDTVLKLSILAVHPFSGEEVPVFVANDDRFTEYYDGLICIPSGCKHDLKFVQTQNIPFQEIISRNNDSKEIIISSAQFSGMVLSEAKEAITAYARHHNFGGHMTSARQFDWLISRQRYWGTPIPIIHCAKCKDVPVPFDQLPVKLPKLSKLSGKGLSPLTEITDWINVKCPNCGGDARRETDTMDTFVDSAWYFLRFCDPHNLSEPFDSKLANLLMPVDLYIGGKEHAIMHLLYARFITHFLHDEGLLQTKEPFKRLLVQGLVMGQSYRVEATGQYIPKDEVELSGNTAVLRGTGEAVSTKWEKMSKSKYNGVDPEDIVNTYGIDTTRLFILSGIPPEHDMLWNTEAISGVVRWKNRLWSLVTRFIELKEGAPTESSRGTHKLEQKLRKERWIAIEEVTRMYSEEYMLSVAISRLIKMTNILRKMPDNLVQNCVEFEEMLCDLVIMVAPMAPHLTSELWKGLSNASNLQSQCYQWDKDVLEQSWPVLTQFEESTPKDVELYIQINNITKGNIVVPYEVATDCEAAAKITLESDIGKVHLSGENISRVLLGQKGYVINFITEEKSRHL